MNDNVLAKAISELEEEIKECRRAQELNTKAVELYSQTINHFESLIKELNVTCEAPDITPIIELINTHDKKIEKAIAEKPVNVIHKKQILFYPEGDGNNFWKFIADKFLKYLMIATFLYVLFLLGAHYWEINSENERYKTMYYYIYHNTDNSSKKYLQNTFFEFQNDSTYKIIREKTTLDFKENKENR